MGGDAVTASSGSPKILRLLSLYPYSQFAHTPCPTKALWSSKSALNVVQTNALPFLAPSYSQLSKP